MRALTTDPIRNFKFLVTIMGTAPVPTTIGQLGFMNVDGLGIQNEVIPYREGGDNSTTRKMPGQTDFGPITMSRGAMASPLQASGASLSSGTDNSNGNVGATAGTSEVYTWLLQVFSAMEGEGAGTPTDNFRCDMTIDVLEHPNTSANNGAGVVQPQGGQFPIKLRFYVMNAWPMGLSWGGLDAGGSSPLIESLQLAHEGFVVYHANNTPGSYISSSAGPNSKA